MNHIHMSTTTPRRVQISPWMSYPLSGLMICMSILTFTGFPSGDGPAWPVLTTFRDPRTMLHVINKNHFTIPGWMYRGAKGVPSILWSISIPLQHDQYVRQTYPAFHRLIGYITILLSLELGLAGYWMLCKGWIMSHEDHFHLHSVRAFPLLKWPTFAVSSMIIGIFHNYSLFRMYIAIRSGLIESHRRWTVFHSMTGYTISFQRSFLLVINAAGWILHAMPDTVKYDWLRVPRELHRMLEAELSAFALSTFAAILATAIWTYFEWSKAGLICGSSPPDAFKKPRNSAEEARIRSPTKSS